MGKMENFIYPTFYLTIKLDNFALVKFFHKCSVWLKIPSLEKRVKKFKVVISRLLQILIGASDQQSKNCCELTVISIINASYKSFLGS